MSKRSQQKQVTAGSRTLRFFREQAKFSLRSAAAASGLKMGVIAHLEQGRINIRSWHLEKLLVAYGTTPNAFEIFASGSVKLPQNIVAECLDLIRTMSAEQLRTVHPVLISIASHK